jgi:hypothetical protein
MPELPSMVPYGADQTLYLVVEACGTKGPAYQTVVERTNLEMIITELMSGRFDNPIGILAFNTLEHWTDDMSEEVAREIQCRCDIEGDRVPEYLAEFIGNHLSPCAGGRPNPRRAR